jgi:hypothetical protein
MISSAFAGQLKVVGDANGDQEVDPRDVILSMQVNAGLRSQSSGVYHKIKFRLSASSKDITYFPVFFGGIYAEAGSYSNTSVLPQPVYPAEIYTVYPGDYFLGFNFRDNISGLYLAGGQGVVNPWQFQLEITSKIGTVLLSLSQASRFLWADNGYGGGNIWTAVHVADDGSISLSPNAPYLTGDADGDNIVDICDVVTSLQVCAGKHFPAIYPDFYHLQTALAVPDRAITYVPYSVYGIAMETGAWNGSTTLAQPVISPLVSVEPGDYTSVTVVLNFRDQATGQYLVGGSGFVQNWDFTVQIFVDGKNVISFNQDDHWTWQDNGNQGGDITITFRLNRDGTAQKI